MIRGNSNKRCVAITGIGMFCPLGITKDECWENMLAGKSGIQRITRFDASKCRTQIAGELPQNYFEMEKDALTRRFYKRSVLPSRLSVLSARQALEDANIRIDTIKDTRMGVITGCGGSVFGDNDTIARQEKKKIISDICQRRGGNL